MQRFIKYIYNPAINRMTSFCCISGLVVGHLNLIMVRHLSNTLFVSRFTLNIPPQTRGSVSQEFAMQNRKMRTRQRFCENVSEIVTTRDEFDPQSATKNTT